MPGPGKTKGVPVDTELMKTFPPPNGTPFSLTGLTNARINRGISQKTSSSDNDRFPTHNFHDYSEPTISFDTDEPFRGDDIDPDHRYTLTFKVQDVEGGVAASGGGRSVTGVNAFLMEDSATLGHREFGTGSLNFGFLSSDGTTDPISISAL